MRIIHDITGKAQTCGGGNAYSVAKGKKAKGFRADVLICVPPDKDKPWIEEEAIFIEGDAKLVLDALRSAIDCIELAGEVLVDEGKIKKSWDK